jgi:hypothetical protein
MVVVVVVVVLGPRTEWNWREFFLCDRSVTLFRIDSTRKHNQSPYSNSNGFIKKEERSIQTQPNSFRLNSSNMLSSFFRPAILALFLLSAKNAVNAGFCNWGPDGTAASSVCEGDPQGGDWCNANQNQCESGCGGNWCSDSSAPPPPSGGGGSCPAGWMPAQFTTYTSYAPCCLDSPNYDPNADTTECDLYSACSYTGAFAYIGNKSFDYVRNNNLIAFFTPNGDNQSFGNKQMRVSANGQTVEVLVADTCGDQDCNGCCTANAQPSGYLVDMEYWTVVNNFGSASAAQGEVCWQLVDGSAPTPPSPTPPRPTPPRPPSSTAPGSCAGSGEIFIEIELQTDDYAAETSWALTRSGGTALVTGSDLDNNRAYTTRNCAPANGCYTFTITDSYGDGMCCGYGQGSFEVNVDGQRVGGGGDFGFESTVSFGQCAPPSQGFCNWGPEGTAASSVCENGPQGGEWCNANQNQCESGCGGNWCS